MGIIAEIKNNMILFTYSITEEANEEYFLHCHNYYEIYYFIEGEVDYLVEGRSYHPTPHSLLLLSPNVFHGVKINSTKPYRRFSFHFHPEIISLERRHLLLSSFPSMNKYSGIDIYYQNVETYRLSSFFASLQECSFVEPELQNEILPVSVEALLSQIKVMSLSKHAAVMKGSNSETVTNIIAYLNQHLTEPFSLDQISDLFFISKHHLNKVFRKATGTTVGDYLLYKRIIYAQQLLINGYPAVQAATAAGFGDYSSFYRAYMKIVGHSPLKDRGVLSLANNLSTHS